MNDRCDRCGATGQTRYVFPNGLDLVFCGHHAREYQARLPENVFEDPEFTDTPVLVTV